MFARLLSRFVLIVALVAAGLALPVLTAPAAQAAGTPDIQLAKSIDANTLFGDDVAVTVTATNPNGPVAYNLTFTDILPANTTFVSSNFGTPTQSIALPDGTTKLVWSNVADLQQGTNVALNYSYAYTSAAYNVGTTFTNTANAYVNSSARRVPRINGTTGAPVAGSYTGSGTASASTQLVPFQVTKTEPSPESELLRGVHDHKTVYTVTVTNNKVAATSNVGLVDYLPAGLEYLGCTSVDNSRAGFEEYPGSGRISDTPAPAMTDCVDAAAVTTVTTDPDGAGPLPAAVYTRVDWTGLGSLAPGATLTLQYAAAIPLRQNVAFTGNSTANLDNNTGALTSDEEALTNIATATGSYGGASYSASGTKTVTAEDVAVQKTVAEPTISQGEISHWTMRFESSEYALATQPIVVTDRIPDGLDFDSATPAPDATPTVQSDNTLLATWTLPAFTAPNSTTTIEYTTTTRQDYRAGGPVSAQDSWSNDVALATTSSVITANTGATSQLSTPDASSASQEAGGVTLTKDVSTAATTSVNCPTADGSYVKSATGYHPGDYVCYRLTATFPGNLNTIGNTIKDFLPDGFTYQSYAFTPASTITDADTTFSVDSDNSNMSWAIDNASSSALFQVIVKAKISSVTAGSDQDITANLAKMTYKNSQGKVFQLRDDAEATLDTPELALDKGISTLNGNAVTGAPAPSVSAEAGDVVGYSVRVSNTGHQDALVSSTRDIIPTQFACSDIVGGSISNGGACASGAIDWTGIAVPAGGSVTLTYSITVPAGVSPGDAFTNNAGVRSYEGQANDGSTFDYYPSNNIDPSLEPLANADPARDTAVVTVASPSVAKSSTTSVTEAGNSATQATIGETITYTVDTSIPEGTTLYGNPAVTDTVPANYAIVGTPSFTVGGGAPQDATVSGQLVTAPLGSSYANAPGSAVDHVLLTITVRVLDSSANKRGVTVTNTGRLTWKNATGTARAVTGSTTNTLVEPNLAQSKTSNAAGGAVSPGQTVTYTLRTTNTGTNVATAHDVVVTDKLPADLTPVSFAPGTYDAGTRTLTFTQATLAPNATAVFTYTAQVANPLISSNSITNQATVTGTSLTGSPVGERSATSATNTGYTSSASVTLKAPDLSIVKTNTTPGSRTIGEDSTYTLAVTIPAGTLAYDTTVLDSLPTNQQFGALVSSSCDSGGNPCDPDASASVIGTPDATDRSIGFFLGDLAPASTATRVVTITYTAIVGMNATAGSTLTNSALVGYDATDKIGTPTTVPAASTFDNRTPASTAQVPVVEPKLTLNKSVLDAAGDPVDSRRAKPGETLTYTIAVANTGTGPAYDVHVTDTPDRRLTDFTAVSGGTVTDGDPSDGTLAWTIPGPLAAGSTATITYRLTIPTTLDAGDEVTGFELSNTADVSSYDGVPAASQVPGRDYKTYSDVTPDTVGVELDLASIGDRVWFDQNGDGTQDAGEPGLVGVKLTVTYAGADGIFGTPDDEVTPVTTGADGAWSVTDLPGGEYKVEVDPTSLPAGLTPSYDLDGGTATPNGLWTGTLAENATKTDVDFGYTGSGSIGERVWYDQNKDGVQDPDEPGLPGALVTVIWAGPDGDLTTTDDNVVYTATTGADGAYAVGNLPAGDFRVTVSGQPVGYGGVSGANGASDTNDTTLTPGQMRVDQDFGFAGTGSIGDYVWLDQNGDGVQDPSEPPIVGASLTATWYGRDGVLGGGDDATFTTTTDAQGRYSFDNLLPGTYVVAVTGDLPKNVTNSYDEDGNGNSSTTVDLAAGETHTTADFGYDVTSIIGDRVWWDRNRDGVQDPGEPGIPGVTVTATFAGADGVFGTPDDLTFTDRTDANGGWSVRDVPDGDYRVAVTSGVPAGFTPTYDADSGTTNPDQKSALTLTGADLEQDFGYSGGSSIGDTVWLDRNGDGTQGADEPGLPDVGVTLVWFGPDGVAGGGDDVTFTTTTDAAGHYSFDGLPEGAYSVTLDGSTLPNGVAPGYDLDGGRDATTLVTLGATPVTNADFGLTGTSSIGDRVWLDRNGDGTLDGAEKGLGGVGVDVLWAGPDGVFGTADDSTFRTTTATDGTYSVTGLPAGDYRVSVDQSTLPAGLVLTHDEDGDLDGIDPITLPADTDHTTATFGYTGLGVIGDTVWLDTNGDGVFDPTEKGVPDQAVTLVWAGPDGQLGTADDQTFQTTTDDTGRYQFADLPDGPFRVTVDGGVAATATNTGDPDGGTPDSADLTLTGGAANLDQDFGYQGSNSIGDRVWWDRNGDGIDQPTEPGLAGVTVEATWFGPDGVAGGGDDVTFTTTTDATGAYLFSNVPDGAYGVKVVSGIPAGLSPSADASGPVDGTSTVTVTGGQTNLDQDFGYAATGAIGDTVWLDANGDGTKGSGEAGIPGVTATLTWAGLDGILGTADDETRTTTTDSKGSYRFDRLAAGDYRVELSNLPSGLTVTHDPDKGIRDQSTLTLGADEQNLDQDFGYRGTASVGDLIWLDVNGNGRQDLREPGLSGITVTAHLAGADGVLGTADDVVVTTKTDKNGKYLFSGLPAGPTRISYDPTGLPKGDKPVSDLDGGDFTSTVVTLAAGENRLDVDYVVRGTSSLNGVVFDDKNGNGKRDPGEPGIGGVTIDVTWDGPNGPVLVTTTTAADGSWSLTGLPSGSYTVAVDPSTVPAGLNATSSTSERILLTPGATGTVLIGYDATALAFTGTEVVWTLFLGLAFLAAGAAAFVVSRAPTRRRRQP